MNSAAAEEQAADAGEQELVAALRRGDEPAFLSLVARYQSTMVRLAEGHVRNRAVAEEVAQETWLLVLKGLATYEGRGSLRAWIFRILVNAANARARRESRTQPLSSFDAGEDGDEPAVDPDRFLHGHARWEGHWARPPQPFPEEQLANAQTTALIRKAIDDLPASQREVITLRDVQQWDSDEVCEALGLSAGNQRVLLHRARSKVRAVLERAFDAGEVRS
jgi:RNA polymerase sigma-70 factor (ECF subfamily)